MNIVYYPLNGRADPVLMSGLTQNEEDVAVASSLGDAISLMEDYITHICVIEAEAEETALHALRKLNFIVAVPKIVIVPPTQNKTVLFDAGADHVVSMPFHMSEIVSRINALHRRNFGIYANMIQNSYLGHEFALDLKRRSLEIDGMPARLTKMEYRITEILTLNNGRVVPRDELYENIYGYKDGASGNPCEVFVGRIKGKFEACAPGSSGAWETVRSQGYSLFRPS